MSDDNATLHTAATEALNRHGHAFQQAVAKAVLELAQKCKVGWTLDASEYPVSVNGVDTHLDLLLRDQRAITYLLLECKRVDPAIGRWLFARADVLNGMGSRTTVVLEDINPPDSRGQSLITPYAVPWSVTPYHFGVELRTPAKKGAGVGGSNDAIAKSVAQVLRGASGLVDHIARRGIPAERGQSLRVVPAIVTTAELWTTEARLGAASLTDGNVDPVGVEWRSVDWLWFNHNRSSSLQPSTLAPEYPRTMSAWLEAYSTRSVAIVMASSLGEFLRHSWR